MIVRALLICFIAFDTAAGQRPTLESTCYQFDQPYFTAVGRFPGGAVFTRRSAVLRFRPDSTPAISPRLARIPMRAVEPVPFEVDSFTYQRWMSMSGWRMFGADSVEIHWRNGLHGPVFRMALRGDSLVGRFVQTTDAHPIPEPPPRSEPARAVRIRCVG
jgi:hypothetical protein